MGTIVDQAVLEGVIETYGSKGGWEGFEERGRSCSWCREPVRLKSSTSRASTEYFKACGNRRSTRWRACANRYRMDARVLVLAGLDGGKGIPEEIRSHPVVFATLTAPSFGAVHRSVSRNGRILPCRPGTKGPCVHGRKRSCAMTHGEYDKIIGEPFCPDCYDYTGAVLFNALVPELWRRVTITTRRNLARLYGRAQWQEDRRQQFFGGDDSDRPMPNHEFVGIGWNNPGEVFFAHQRQREMFEVRQMLREACLRSP
ncbi:MAG TPA: replication initiator [Acidimicrobiales bacterium]|nr:replication initiator [Acidimicrobiales bacterium]